MGKTLRTGEGDFGVVVEGMEVVILWRTSEQRASFSYEIFATSESLWRTTPCRFSLESELRISAEAALGYRCHQCAGMTSSSTP